MKQIIKLFFSTSTLCLAFIHHPSTLSLHIFFNALYNWTQTEQNAFSVNISLTSPWHIMPWLLSGTFCYNNCLFGTVSSICYRSVVECRISKVFIWFKLILLDAFLFFYRQHWKKFNRIKDLNLNLLKVFWVWSDDVYLLVWCPQVDWVLWNAALFFLLPPVFPSVSIRWHHPLLTLFLNSCTKKQQVQMY